MLISFEYVESLQKELNDLKKELAARDAYQKRMRELEAALTEVCEEVIFGDAHAALSHAQRYYGHLIPATPAAHRGKVDSEGKCKECGGSGKAMMTDGLVKSLWTCPSCHGTGRTTTPAQKAVREALEQAVKMKRDAGLGSLAWAVAENADRALRLLDSGANYKVMPNSCHPAPTVDAGELETARVEGATWALEAFANLGVQLTKKMLEPNPLPPPPKEKSC